MPAPRRTPSPARTSERGALGIGSFFMMPWWAWLLVGGCLYFVLRGAHTLFDDASAPRWATVIDAAAIGVLIVCTIAGALSFMLRRGDWLPDAPEQGRANDGVGAPHKAHAPRMSWGQFEMLAVEAFRRRGFQVTERGSSGDDGSRNLELRRGRQHFLAHCKAWRMTEVDIGAVRELYSMVIVAKAHGGIVITTGNFTQEARTFAAGRQLQLIDGKTLRELLRDDDGGAVTIMPTIIPTNIIDLPTVTR